MTEEPCRFCNGTKQRQMRRRRIDPVTTEDCAMCDGRFEAVNRARHVLIHRKHGAGLSKREHATFLALQRLTAWYCDGAARQWEYIERIERELQEFSEACVELDRLLAEEK